MSTGAGAGAVPDCMFYRCPKPAAIVLVPKWGADWPACGDHVDTMDKALWVGQSAESYSVARFDAAEWQGQHPGPEITPAAHPVLDWSDSHTMATRPKPCVHCGGYTPLRERETGIHEHKACAEAFEQAQHEGVA